MPYYGCKANTLQPIRLDWFETEKSVKQLGMFMAHQPPPLTHPSEFSQKSGFNKASLIKKKQWLISPDHKAGYLWRGGVQERRGGLAHSACPIVGDD